MDKRGEGCLYCLLYQPTPNRMLAVNYYDHEIEIVGVDRKIPASISLIVEEPIFVRVQGQPYTVILRTPGDERSHVAGFCLGEGIVDRPADIVDIDFGDGQNKNVAMVTLTAERHAKISEHLDRRTYISQTSDSVCGKTIVDDLVQVLSPLPDSAPLDGAGALNRLIHLGEYQPLRAKTRAAHAAAIYDQSLERLSLAEDVGRHNALDKAIGSVFLNGQLSRARLLTLSSRISYELVQKAARARVPVILAVSRPTALAVHLATALGMTLATLTKDDGLMIHCHAGRLTWHQGNNPGQ